eukprot:UN01062
MFARSLITTQKRFAGGFAKKHNPIPVAKTVYVVPSRVRPAHYTDAEIAALPKPVANPDLTKNKYAFLFPFAIPGATAWAFYVLNNYTQFYNDRITRATPFKLYG